MHWKAFLTIAGVVALGAGSATTVAAQDVEMKTCTFAGVERTVSADTNCPQTLIGALRELEVERQVMVSDDEGNEQMQTVKVGFDRFADLLAKSGLRKHLAEGRYTLFVPTDQAVARAMENGELMDPAALEDDAAQDAAANAVGRHVVQGLKRHSGCYCLGRLTAITGQPVEYNWINPDGHYVNGRDDLSQASKLEETDIVAANGVIHVVDRPFTN